MASETNRRLAQAVRSILSGRDWVYLGSLLIPLVVYNLVLKEIRISSQDDIAGGFAAFGLVRSDLLFNLGYVFLWIGLFALTRQSRLRLPVLVLFHVATIVVAATTTAASDAMSSTCFLTHQVTCTWVTPRRSASVTRSRASR